MTTPVWLTRSEGRFGACTCCGRRSKGDLVEKTLAGGSRLVRTAMFSAELAGRDGFLQGTDARVKVAATAVLLLVAAVVEHVSVLVGPYAAVFVLAVMSRVPWRFLFTRVWCFVPLFTGVVVVPAVFSFVTPGHVVVGLGTWFGTPVGITSQGLGTAALLVARVATSISLVVVLTITTPWPRLLAALRALFVPRMFVVVLALAYRYLFDLLNAVTDMYEARKARAPRDRDVARGRAFVAATAGATFGRAHALSEEVFLAMVARGYSGQATAVDRKRIALADAVVIVAAIAVVLVALGADRAVR
jgi:cobalt/nickel transport system permease protein